MLSVVLKLKYSNYYPFNGTEKTGSTLFNFSLLIYKRIQFKRALVIYKNNTDYSKVPKGGWAFYYTIQRRTQSDDKEENTVVYVLWSAECSPNKQTLA